MFSLSTGDIAELQDTLLAWFASVRRPLPWRLNRSAYGTWISEIMLQQTTVGVVQPYWLRFMERFPDVQSLAEASREEVLAHWSGLGYYRRAEHLHLAAKQIVAAGGELPSSRQEWAQLPGIGPYASGAIASLTLGEPVPAIDANARRVLTRWLVSDPRDLARLRPSHLEKHGGQLVPASDPGSWNEAVMELGALVCRARAPHCLECPVLHLCRAGLAGNTEDIPAQAVPAQARQVLMGVLVVRKGNKILMMPPGSHSGLALVGPWAEVRSDFSGLHQGLWGLPGTAWVDPRSKGGELRLLSTEGFSDRVGEPGVDMALASGVLSASVVGEFRHAITHYRLQVKVFLLFLPVTVGLPGDSMNIDLQDLVDYSWKQEDFGQIQEICRLGTFTDRPLGFPLSNLARKALKLVDDQFC